MVTPPDLTHSTPTPTPQIATIEHDTKLKKYIIIIFITLIFLIIISMSFLYIKTIYFPNVLPQINQPTFNNQIANNVELTEKSFLQTGQYKIDDLIATNSRVLSYDTESKKLTLQTTPSRILLLNSKVEFYSYDITIKTHTVTKIPFDQISFNKDDFVVIKENPSTKTITQIFKIKL